MTAILKAAQVRARVAELSDERVAEDEVNRRLYEARQEGYRDGVADGLQQAREAGAQAVPRVAAALEELARTASRTHAEAVALTSTAVLDAATQIAEWLVREHLACAPRGVLTQLDEIAKALVITEPCSIFVASADLVAVSEWAQTHGSLDVSVDAALQPGEVRMVTRTGRAEFLVTDALTRARELLGGEQ